MGIFRKKKPVKPTHPKIALGILVVLLAVFGFLKASQSRALYADLWIADTYVHAEVANTNSKRAKGLSGRSGLEEGEGLLLLFERRQSHGIWMKEMTFPIDIIWLDEGKVVDIAPDVSPPDDPTVSSSKLKRYFPRVPALAVLEVPAGFATKHEWKIGDTVLTQFDK